MQIAQGTDSNQQSAAASVEAAAPAPTGTELPVQPPPIAEAPVDTANTAPGAAPETAVAGQVAVSTETPADAAAANEVKAQIASAEQAPAAAASGENLSDGQGERQVHPTVAAAEAMKTKDLGALEGVVEGKPVVAPQENEQDLAGIVTAATTGSTARAETAAPPVIEATSSTAPVATPTPAPEPIVAADPTVPPDAAPVVDAAAKPTSDTQILTPAANQAPPAPAVPEPVAPAAIAAEPVASSVEQQPLVINLEPYIAAREEERNAGKKADEALRDALGVIDQNNANEVGKDIAA